MFCMVVTRTFLAGRFPQIFDFAQYSSAVCGEVFFGYTNEPNNAPIGRNAEGVGHESLNEGGITFIGSGLDLRRESCESENVGRVKGTGVQKALGVSKSDENGGGGAVITLGKMLGEVVEECIFIFDLWTMLAWSQD